MRQGFFITFEGPDGAGKTTQITKLRDYLAEQGLETILTREPGGTQIGEKIRNIILDPLYQEMGHMTEAILYAASRAQHVEEKILPSLNAGKTVICDRFVDSSIAYQGYGRKLGESVRKINEIAVRGLVPDLTFLLLVDPKVGKERISNGWLDRLEMEELNYHADVYAGYLEIASKNPHRILAIDGAREIEEISNEITLKMGEFLKMHRGKYEA
ncbi:MAG TPA: dTMP kinase [Anaerovoracaceae bacterium]|nr:dTMP kinase [Anaerovoracaceae bacterium]